MQVLTTSEVDQGPCGLALSRVLGASDDQHWQQPLLIAATEIRNEAKSCKTAKIPPPPPGGRGRENRRRGENEKPQHAYAINGDESTSASLARGKRSATMERKGHVQGELCPICPGMCHWTRAGADAAYDATRAGFAKLAAGMADQAGERGSASTTYKRANARCHLPVHMPCDIRR
eukprot:3876490-Rhodomonas_salina.3